jgi:methionine-rich copper-binding protein CopC
MTMTRLQKKWSLSAAAFVMVAMMPLAAFAHAHPTKMNPAANSVGPAPAQLVVTFSEAVEPKFSTLQVDDASGKVLTPAKAEGVAGDAKTLTLALPKLGAGVYTVKWVSVATDGHRLAGEYKFTVQ